jgi:hypothetical protein
MKVKKLIKALKKLDPEAVVVMSIDPEGNGYRPLYAAEDCRYEDGEIGYAVINLRQRNRRACPAEELPLLSWYNKTVAL